MYLEYSDYQNMGGTLDETTFNTFEYEAETIVNWYTFNRLKGETEYPEELARCMYRLIYLAKLEADALLLGSQTTTTVDGEGNVTSVTTGAYIQSQSNDGVSVRYNSVDASDIFNRLSKNDKDNPLMNTVFRYLQGVRNSLGKRLTYRGLYPDE
jgi:hypothetical protein